MPHRDRRLLRFARSNRATPTPGERALWNALRRRAAGARFRRQEPIGPYIVDLVCLTQRIVIEIDGDRHESPARQVADGQRDQFLRDLGYVVLRFTESDARTDPAGIADDVWGRLSGNRRVPSVFEFAHEDGD